jgi:hypothetical protein
MDDTQRKIEHAKAADRIAVLRALTTLRRTDEYKNADDATKERLAEAKKRAVMEKR